MQASNWELLSGLKVTHIVNCSRTSNFDGTGSNPFSAWINYFCCGFPDNASADFTDAIEQTYDFIDRSLSAHPRWVVLVHCASGVSRSVALVFFYLLCCLYLWLSATQLRRGFPCRQRLPRNSGDRPQHQRGPTLGAAGKCPAARIPVRLLGR